ncbi:toxin TcdB middle/N-terminal domain-containing protein [Actinomadura sp. HBU206391]|uniref:toxin TcdB middle/N-terminal domain-containing protein n=1 Tax=Actinomadura sp. HBU206391 TaxID=2731692 RepID=UPI0016501339|nr:toxin TcdB middle/N-terminal domain-containing protein [Actinomadura sp. HBU206391]MBC6461716.1 VCBS repeat-containing protein [Actinomadura sp. HBU206391]
MSTPETRTGVTAPPSGNGAATGLGEAFSINLNTGQGVYSYKLPLPEGRAGHGAKVALEYAHGNGLGLFGLGWRLAPRSIARRLDFGLPGTQVAERFLDGGQELVETPDGSYAAARESAFTRYRRSAAGWLVEERTGVVHECGLTEAGRVADPDHPGRVQEWLVERSIDACGNTIEHEYERDGGLAYPATIRWAAYELRFVYEERPDVRQDARAGFLRTLARRCHRIELFVDPGTESERCTRTWSLSYEQDPVCGVSLLVAITLTSHGGAADGSQDVTRAPVRLGYAPFDQRAARVSFIEPPAAAAAPPTLDAVDTALVTLDRAPLPGVLQVTGGQQWYWPNRGDGRWGRARPVAETPTIGSFGESGVLFADADGSGTADMLVAGVQPVHGYYENGGDDGWARFVAYPRGHAAAPPWSSGTVRLMDVDGDGRVDAIASDTTGFTVWRNGGPDGWSEPLHRPVEHADGPVGVDFADPLVRLADMNGDGLLDIVRIASGRVEYWPGLGDGRFGARVEMASSPRLRGLTSDPGSVVLVDANGDGCTDLVRVAGNAVDVAINRNGREFSEPARIAPVPGVLPGTLCPANMKGRAGAGLLWCSLRFGRPAYVQLEFAPDAPPYVLISVDNGSGLRSELTYRSAVEDYLRDADQGVLWATNLPFPLAVVASTREVDAVSGQETVVEYSYHEGHFAPSTRQFQGFRRTERVERGDESRPDTLTVSHFLMDQERAPGHGREHVELNGMLERSEVFALDGTPDENRPYRVEESDYELESLPVARRAARPRAFVIVTAHRTEDRERTDDVRGEERTYEYDAHGNVTRETTRGYGVRDGVEQPERVLVTEVEYATSAVRHLIGLPARIVERDGAGAIVRERRRYYDAPDFAGLPLGEADRGLLVREEQLVLSDSEFTLHYEGMDVEELGYHTGTDADGTPSVLTNSERCAYDARGVKVARRDALGHEETYEYDPDGLFPTLARDGLGETRYVYDRALGQPTSIEYPDGKVAGFTYDAQGRVTTSLRPGDDPAAPPRTYAYDDRSLPNARTATFRASAAAHDACVTVTYFDGHGREFQQRVEAEPGRVLVSALGLRNPWGDVRREYEPREATSLGFTRPDTSGRPHRAMRYDARGRVVRTADFGAGASRVEYRPFEVVLRDAGRADTPRREEFDVLRDRTRVVQELGDGAVTRTSFEVGPAGDLLAVHDDSGTLGTYTYDRMGRRLVADHREGGRRRVYYDARGAGVGSSDANGNDLRAEIDAQGRLVRLTLAGSVVEEFTYDDPARNAFGRIASVTYPGGRQDFTYDAAGRIERHEYGFDGARTERLSFEYDGLGRELAVTHTDGRRIARELTSNGWVRAIPGILDEISYDPRGLPTALRYANGVVTEVGYGPGPGRVEGQRTNGPAGQALHDVTYDRDDRGLLTRSDDATPGGAGVREYSYDALQQLREVKEGSAPALAYAYDRHYNLTAYGDTGAALHHDDPGHAYRLTGVTQAGGALEAVAHDLNGNVTSRGAQRFTYDYKQALQRFEDGAGLVAEYGYDPFGARVSKVVDDGRGTVTRTFFVGEHAEIRDGTPTLFARVGQLRVAVLQPDGTRYVHPDPLGTTAFFTDEAGAKVAAIAYLPFGNVAASVGEIDQRCFGSHAFDAESGLYYMQRRHYDPVTARFLQPDPIAVLRPERYLTTPRAFHPYAYVGNDPMNNADPTGLSFWSVVGAIAGVIAAGVVVAYTFGFGLLAGMALGIGMVTVAYVVASSAGGTPLGEFARGFLIGLNGGLNLALGAGVPAMIGLMFAFEGEEFNLSFMRPVLGWSSWFAPMSWIATGVGLSFFLFNAMAAGYSRIVPGGRGGDWQKAQISAVRVDWPTGAIVTQGGLTEPIGSDGYNLGNFIYINRTASLDRGDVLGHEAGHTLNVAAYGGIFHFIGAIDENIGWPPRGAGALAELYAESNDPSPDGLPAGFSSGPKAWYMVWV